MKRFIVGVAALVASGCAQGPPITTASGKPDAIMRGVDRACVREVVMNHVLTTGWDIKASSDIHIVAQREVPMSFGAVMMSTGYGLPHQRVTFNLVPSGPDLRMVIDGAVVANAGTAFERVQPIRFDANDQATLEAAAGRAEAKCRKL